MVEHMQHGSLSTILEPCIATPLLIPMVFSEWEQVDVQRLPFWIKLDLEMLVVGWGSRSTWSTPRKPQQQTQTTYGINRGV